MSCKDCKNYITGSLRCQAYKDGIPIKIALSSAPASQVCTKFAGYDPSQERDSSGRWTSGGGSGSGTAIAYAPYRSRNVESLDQDKKIREGEDFVAFQSMISDVAKDLGVKIYDKLDTWGGYVDSETGIPVQEVSNILHTDATGDTAKLMAAIIGSAAPEQQDSVLVGSYDKNGSGTELSIKTGSFDNAREALGLLKKNGLEYFSVDKNSGDIILLDLDNSQGEKLVSFINDLKERNLYNGAEKSKVSADFIGKDDYMGIIGAARSSNQSKGWGNLDAIIEKARGRYQKGQKVKLAGYDPDQERDASGRWTSSGSSSTKKDKAYEYSPALKTPVASDEVDDFMAKAKEAVPEMEKILQNWANRYDATYKDVALKSRGSIIRKAGDEYGGDVSRVYDGFRSTMVLGDDQDYDKVISELERDPATFRVKRQYTDLGYYGTIVNVKTSSGAVGEIQVNTPEIMYGKIAKDLDPTGKKSTDDIVIDYIGKSRFNEIKKLTGLEAGLGHKYYEIYRVEKVKGMTDPEAAKKADEAQRASLAYYAKLATYKKLKKIKQ